MGTDRSTGTYPVMYQVFHRLRVLAREHGPVIDKHIPKEAYAVQGLETTKREPLLKLARSASRAYIKMQNLIVIQ